MRGLSNERKAWVLDPRVNAFFLMLIRNKELKELAKPFGGRPWNVRPDGAYRKSRDGWELCMRWNKSSVRTEAVITSPEGKRWVLH